MARLSMDGLDGLLLSFEELAELPDELADAMLDAEADVVLAAQRAEAAQLGMYAGYSTTNNNARDTTPDNSLPGQVKNYSTGELARSIRKSKPKSGEKGKRSLSIYFAGSRRRGKRETKNGEIAFLNEYGTRTINARNFIRAANEKSAGAAAEAAAKVYDNFLKSKNL